MAQFMGSSLSGSMTGPAQVVLDQSLFKASIALPFDDPKIWRDHLVFPAYAAAVSVVVLLLHGVVASGPVQRLTTRLFASNKDTAEENNISLSDVPIDEKSHVEKLGGPVIFGFLVVRLLSCLALLGLSVATFVLHHSGSVSSLGLDKWLQIAVCGTYAYTSLLAFAAVISKLRLSNVASAHAVFVLLVVWGVFVYRDVWPLATYTLSPLDAAEGALLWVKLAILTLAAVVIPLSVPRRYVPVDPLEPSLEVAPEQTASIISLLIYSFLDPIIFLAYRIPHLSFDQLPPLADYDFAKYLVKRSHGTLDPFKSHNKRHLFWNLMSVFRYEYTILGITCMIASVTQFAGPVGINQLLYHLESGGKDVVVQPWVWVLWLLLGPVTGALSFQFYIFIATRMLVQAQAILTQLVYDHALRIRMKAETSPESASSSRVSTAAATPDNASVAETEQEQEQLSGSVDVETTTSTTAAGTDSGKGKQKSQAASTGDSKQAADDKDTKASNLIGKINNLVTSDLNNITSGRDIFIPFIIIPCEMTLGIIFLYTILGWSAIIGILATIALFPIPGYVTTLLHKVQQNTMKSTDARVQTVTETMGVIRMIKLFGWEPRMSERIAEKRDIELQNQWKVKALELINANINFIIPMVTMAVTYVVYTVGMKQELTASRVYSSMAVFEVFRGNLQAIFQFIPTLVQAKVSLDRVNDFLHKTELLDEFTEKSEGESAELVLPKPDIPPGVIGFRDASFTWANDADGSLTPGGNRRIFTLRIEEELLFKRGQINLIVGPTGSGKTSVLMALLGELHYIPTSPESFYSLPRNGGVAYAAQESWVQSETIRDNIIFGAPFDEERYNKVIEQCCLERDLSLFEAGDKTEVGEKGLTLSGGQKARITLARAVYSSAAILLLDDVLAALDVHTARWIVDKCFKGDLIRGRTVILVTHNVALASPIAEFVVSLGTDGRILSQGSLATALASNVKLSKEIAKEAKVIDKAEDEVPPADADPAAKKSGGKLIAEEEISVGQVGWPAFKLYFDNLGGRYNFLFWLAFLGGIGLCEISNVIQSWWLGYWASQYETHHSSEVSVFYYLGVYGLMLVFAVLIYAVGYVTYVYGTLRASRNIHKTLVNSVLGTTLRWLDVTPTSRIIARCTQDIQSLDRSIASYFGYVVDLTITMLMKFIGVLVVSPVFILPGLVVALLGGWCGQIYMKGQLATKREMSNARSPVLGHFGAAIAGLTSIRAYGAQDAFRQESYKRIDKYSRAARTFYNLNRWVCIRIETLGGLFAAGLAAYLVYFTDVKASNTGFSLTMAVSFSSMILWWVRCFNEFQISANSLERIHQYVAIEQEAKPTESGVPPAYWPASGELRVEKLSARYSADGPKVLKDISFEVKAGERIGIVGRTGSGKSSLTLALLRCILTEGKVYFDDLPTDQVNLDALRSQITIIPQVPELLSGTLRQNLDPFDQYDDAVLNDALRSAGLFSIQEATDESRITLDSQISSGGGNLSVGQRQILALARAIIRQSKLLILDEATSAIDYETDTVIQTSLRRELSKDVSLLTVAHRLQTIMDADRIMVLDAGQIAEFDKPLELLKKETGLLRALVDESSDKEILHAMAENAAQR